MRKTVAILCLVLIASAVCAADRLRLQGVPGQWWSPMWAARWAGIIVGTFGSLCGILGALTGWLAPQGKAKGLILGTWTVMVIVAAVSLVAGLVALIARQPFYVCYPLLLCGFIGAVVGGSLMRVVRMRYDEAELRRMNAQDVSGTGMRS